MGISLYTSRVILKALGATDFGIYSLVGGAVVLFTFIKSAMTSSTQRYLNVAIGKKKDEEITKVFSTSIIIHLIVIAIFIILAETVGLWFVCTQLNIPPDREFAAIWVYQITILTTCVTTICCPYSAAIIAYERMDYFAKVSIVEAVLKLGVSFAILYAPFDRLIYYALLLLLSQIFITFWCGLFCHRNFAAIRFSNSVDRKTMESMTGFSLWSLLGNSSLMASNQGINMLLNMSFNVIVNAAMGIAYQVNTAASALVSNFQTAFMPQITKSYASNETSYLQKLIYTTSRFSFLLCFVVSYPIFINCDAILRFWLSVYPEFTPGLVKVIIICVGLDALSGPLWMTAHARGNIRNYQLTVSIFLLTTLLACYIAVKMGYSPVIAFGSRIIVLFLLYVYRIIYTRNAVGMNIGEYAKKVLWRCGLIVTASIGLGIMMSQIPMIDIVRIMVDFACAVLLILLIGINSSERSMVIAWCRNRFSGSIIRKT